MSGTILLADDSLTIQKVVELTFADTDYRVVAVSSGDELLDRMAATSPDLIICDVIMPGKDGYDVCQEIKSSSDWLHLPVILLTGTFEPFDRDRAIAAGCSEIITKPFEAQKLVDTVERLIGSAQPTTAPADTGASFMADEEEWPDEATPVDVPQEPAPQPESERFGTQLSSPADDDGIEFTTSGFAEMEAAGQASHQPTDGSEIEDGLDYEPGGLAGDEPAEPTPAPPPAPEPASAEDPNAQTVKIDMSHFTGDQPEDQSETETEEAVPGGDRQGPLETVAEPFAGAQEEPFEAAVEPPADDDGTPAFTDEPSMADTSPVDPPAEEVKTPTSAASFELSDEDVDRIARRVIELASNRLDEIAWEIVPDMAEIVVRERIRELEAEAGAATPDAVQ